MSEEKQVEKPEEPEDTTESRRLPKDLLVLQRTIRALEELTDNERNAVLGYLAARYQKEE